MVLPPARPACAVKVLLDENIDHRLRKHLGVHDVYTVDYRGWAGLKNGVLLQVAEAEGFEPLSPPMERLQRPFSSLRKLTPFRRRRNLNKFK